MDETVKSAVIDSVIALARAANPEVQLSPKYGGTVFIVDPDAPESVGMVGGVFASKNHVSVEFSQGVHFNDPGSHLEGKGKVRRHLKLRGLSDIEDKDVAGFLARAFARHP